LSIYTEFSPFDYQAPPQVANSGDAPATKPQRRCHHRIPCTIISRIHPSAASREPSSTTAVVPYLAVGEDLGLVNWIDWSTANVAADVARTHLSLSAGSVRPGAESVFHLFKFQNLRETLKHHIKVVSNQKIPNNISK
jgi:hypothetical protein